VALLYLFSALSVFQRHHSLPGTLLACFFVACALDFTSSAPIVSRSVTLQPGHFQLLVACLYAAAGGLIALVHFAFVFPAPKAFLRHWPWFPGILYGYFGGTVTLYGTSLIAFGATFPFFCLWIFVMIGDGPFQGFAAVVQGTWSFSRSTGDRGRVLPSHNGPDVAPPPITFSVPGGRFYRGKGTLTVNAGYGQEVVVKPGKSALVALPCGDTIIITVEQNGRRSVYLVRGKSSKDLKSAFASGASINATPVPVVGIGIRSPNTR
jgi:hypothetical protein